MGMKVKGWFLKSEVIKVEKLLLVFLDFFLNTYVLGSQNRWQLVAANNLADLNKGNNKRGILFVGCIVLSQYSQYQLDFHLRKISKPCLSAKKKRKRHL